ncbi:MAG: hypothetical protein EHM53_02785 [Methanoregulaceae archaeon]|nr:MAG: hypothetical protein EHM53_02785 [Methanoregulaceae archaeon]
MKGFTKWIISAIVLIFCIHAVSAFGVSSITVDPSGSLTPGTPVIVTFKVDFSPSGEETFPSANELQLSTDLDKAKWSYSLVLDGVDAVQPSNTGRVLSVSGWVLSYPAAVEEAMKVTLEGTAPTVSQTTNKTMIKIAEYDSHSNLISSTVVERTAVVVNIAEIQNKIAEVESTLLTYRSHIDEKSALGIDTASAEAKYSEADQKIKSAKNRPSTQFTLAFSDLNAAETAVADGEVSLDRAWAENEVTNANIPINNVDNVIAWFKGNKSTSDDVQLPAIIAKREVAVSYISTANDEISNGNYAQARAKAQDAFNKGNESYTDALKRQKDLGEGWFAWLKLPTIKLPGGIFLIVGVIVVVLAVVGYVIYRKRSRWDELG